MPDLDYLDIGPRLKKAADQLDERIADSMEARAADLLKEIRSNLSGRVLKRQSGALYRSASVQVLESGADIKMKITAGSPSVPYASIHEFGGQTGRGGKTTIPARPYIKPAIESEIPKIKDAIGDELVYLLIKGIK